MTLQRAVEVFAHGFAFTRSFTHPYVIEQKHGLTVMRDGPRKSGGERNREHVVCGMSPEQGLTALKKIGFHSGAVAVVDDMGVDFDKIRDTYKAAGFVLLRREPMFAADPHSAPVFESPLPIERVNEQRGADAVKKAARRRQLLPEHLGREDTIRLYAAFMGDAAIGFVSSIPVGRDAWVSNLYVDKAMRGRGIGRALMSALLQDDARHEVETSVLLASGAGARLYPHVGYEQIGTLQLFVLAKK